MMAVTGQSTMKSGCRPSAGALAEDLSNEMALAAVELVAAVRGACRRGGHLGLCNHHDSGATGADAGRVGRPRDRLVERRNQRLGLAALRPGCRGCHAG